jgi:regulation of enolase protein 1 (concanavalin A-like superfamily)
MRERPKTHRKATPKGRRRLVPRLEGFEPRLLLASNPGFLQGVVFVDGNQNNVLDVGEPGLPGATVQLLDGSGNPVGSQATGADGSFLFTNLAPGRYQLVETPPSGYINQGVQTTLSPLDTVLSTTKNSITVQVADPGQWVVSANNNQFFALHPLPLAFQLSTDNGAHYSTEPTYIGPIPITVAGQSFTSYCTDVIDSLDNTGTDVFPVLGEPGTQSQLNAFGNAGRIGYLFNHFANDPAVQSNAVQAQGLQMAIWKLEYDATTDFTKGNLKGVSAAGGSTPAQVNAVLAAASTFLAQSQGHSEPVIDLDANAKNTGSSGYQSLLAPGALNFGDVPFTPATPSITTSQQPASATVGTPIADKATVTGGNNPGGTVTFNLYDNPNASGTPLFTDANEPLVNGVATSKGYVATATGTDYWVATYNGDSYNNPVTSGAADEPVTVTPASPSIATVQQPASAVVGSSIADQATVSGGYNPGGTVTFSLYDNPNASGIPLFVDANEPLVNGVATSKGYVATATGTDYWVATYNGDANNSPVTGGAALEPVVISPASPSISTLQQPAGATVGTPVADQATISGGYYPGGTVTFALYDNPNGTGTPLFTDANEPLVNGVATSKGYVATATGTDYWVATYNGDSNNTPVTSGTADEPVAITPAAPSISTSQQPASAVVGSPVADRATVTGGFNPGGTVTFTLYNNPNGIGTPLFVDANEPLVNGVATSKGYTATAIGTDYWVATYNSDSNNTPVTSGTGDEPVAITPASPSIGTSQQPAAATVGTAVADRATVTGGYNPGGTVTFTLYNNPNATGTPLFVDANEPLVNGVATSKGYTATATGTDYWVATYNGDANNSPVSSGPADEPVVLSPASPSIATSQQPASATRGTAIADTATVVVGFHPTGTVTFRLYNNPNGAGTPLFVDTEPLVNGTATSKGFVTTATGTDYWVATYNGDANNNPVTASTSSEPVTITAPSPVSSDEFATIGFWQNRNGQAVIDSFNGGSTQTQLGNWLATNFPHLFGASNPYISSALQSLPGKPTTFAGLTNAQIASVYGATFGQNGGAKNTYLQAFAVALGMYADNPGLGYDATAAKYGFAPVTGGGGSLSFNLGNNGVAFSGLGSTPTVLQILQAVDASFNPTTGLFFGGDSSKTTAANNVLNGINTAGDVH